MLAAEKLGREPKDCVGFEDSVAGVSADCGIALVAPSGTAGAATTADGSSAPEGVVAFAELESAGGTAVPEAIAVAARPLATGFSEVLPNATMAATATAPTPTIPKINARGDFADAAGRLASSPVGAPGPVRAAAIASASSVEGLLVERSVPEDDESVLFEGAALPAADSLTAAGVLPPRLASGLVCGCADIGVRTVAAETR